MHKVYQITLRMVSVFAIKDEKTYCEYFPNNKRHINNGEREQYYSTSNHAPIISTEIFELVQKENLKRSNINVNDTEVKRKSTHYSMKLTKDI